MKRPSWQVIFGIALVLTSALLYFGHYLIFNDPHHIAIYMVGDLAFVPIEVLLVTMIIHELLGARERRARRDKMNMVVGSFFSEMGTTLLVNVSDADPGLDEIRNNLLIASHWSDSDFKTASRNLKKHNFRVDKDKLNLDDMREFLFGKRDFLLRLLENPNLLEHESFTELLFAVFHLSEELAARGELTNIQSSDLTHLAGDVDRIYVLLVDQWLDYMDHLKKNYPYLFSLALRTNPFDQSASPIVL